MTNPAEPTSTTPDSPTRTITVQGLQFQVRWPYSEGHVCSAIEAEALNKARAENIRNNFAKRVTEAQAEAKATNCADESEVNAQLAMAFDTYDRDYEFGLLSPRSMDPVGREAQRISGIIVREQLNRRGQQEDDMEPEALKRKINETALLPAVRMEAERRLNAMKDVATQALSEIES